MPAKRIRCFDIAKGIAMICIILGHLDNQKINCVAYTFHVPIFYLIAGYFIRDNHSVRVFAQKKFRTLIVPYLFTCMVMILLAALRQGLFYGPTAAARTALEWLCAAVYGSGADYQIPFPIKSIGGIWFLLAAFWGSIFLRQSLAWKRGPRVAWILGLFAVGYVSSERLFWFPLSIQAGCCATLFLYLGYLIRTHGAAIKRIPLGAKVAVTAAALGGWISFIRDYQGFWMVRNHFGSGVGDVIRCLCGCGIVLLISMGIDRYTRRPAKVLSDVGSYSLVALCVHIVEQNLFPWTTLIRFLIGCGMPEGMGSFAVVLGKFLLIFSATVICAKWNVSRKLFGYPEKKGRGEIVK